MEKRGYVHPDWTPEEDGKAKAASKKSEKQEIERLDSDLKKNLADHLESLTKAKPQASE